MSAEITEPVRKDKQNSSRGQAFVEYVINRCHSDKGARAALTRADNPATEYQSWEILAGFHVNLEYENQRLPFATIGAAIARAKVEQNGNISIGKGIASCYEEGNESAQAKARLRRLLACENVAEACRIIRPVLNLIASKSNVDLDYARLLDDLLWFDHAESQTRIKARWAQDFYARGVEEEKNG
jgi:CRISPR system Cascade subunit CasB